MTNAYKPPGQGSSDFSPRDLEKHRLRLERLRGDLAGNVASLTMDALQPAGGEQSGGISNAPLHLADLATHSQEQHLALGLLESEKQFLHDIDAALERIAHGTYGRCLVCDQIIPAGRLEAVPHTSMCIACAEKSERE